MERRSGEEGKRGEVETRRGEKKGEGWRMGERRNERKGEEGLWSGITMGEG